MKSARQLNKIFIKTLIYIYFSIMDIVYGYLVIDKYIRTHTYLKTYFSGTNTALSIDRSIFNYL